MPPKRPLNSNVTTNKQKKRKAVTLQTKLEVLRRHEAGEKIHSICRALKLAKSTVQTIRDDKDKIKAYSLSVPSETNVKITRQRSTIMEKMEHLLSIWIEDNNQRNMPMSQMTIQEKAKSIYENLKESEVDEATKDETFLASRGWFEKFKKRQNLHNIKMKGEAASADHTAANEYPNILKRIIETEGYKPEQVFNVDETGLYWKRMPERTYISRSEKSASGYKVSKERLTLLLGSNASGDFKLKPLLVYFSENPRAFKSLNKKNLPVIWKSNKKAWMTKNIFEDWYKNHFCPAVEEYLKKNNLSNKALLLLDNAPGHPVNLSEISENIKVEFLPKNTTSLIQPMDQGAIATFKAYYLRRTFQQLVEKTDGESSIKQFWKNYNIKDAVDNISQAWQELQSTTMNKIWRKIWPEVVKANESDADSLREITQNILDLGNELGFLNLEDDDVQNLLDADRGYMSDNELMQLETLPTIDEPESEPVTCQNLTAKVLSKALSLIEEGVSMLVANDHDADRSSKFARGISSTCLSYQELLEEAKKNAQQTTLNQFFKPAEASTSQQQEDKDDTVSTCSSSDASMSSFYTNII